MENHKALSVGFGGRNAVYVNRAARRAAESTRDMAQQSKQAKRVGEISAATIQMLSPNLMRSLAAKAQNGGMSSAHPVLRIAPDRMAHLVAHKVASELPLRPIAFNNAGAVVLPGGTAPITISVTRNVNVVALEWDSATADQFRIRSLKFDRFEPNLATEDMAATLFSSARQSLRSLDASNIELTAGQAITFTAANIGAVAAIPSGSVWVIDEVGGC